MHFVYILKSKKDDQRYIGCTKDLKARIANHNADKVFSTKKRGPFELVYYEAYRSPKDAWTREQNLKLRKKSYAQLKKRIINSLNNLVGG